MRIGVGLPTSTPPTGARHRGPELLTWATRAEAGPFASLGVTDRLVYDCTHPMVAPAAAAAVTPPPPLGTKGVNRPIPPAAGRGAPAPPPPPPPRRGPPPRRRPPPPPP